MSIPTKNPLRMMGAIPNSGFPNTGELPYTRGGMQTACVFSGGVLSPGSGFLGNGVKTADQLLLASGAGRLNSVVLLGPPGFTLSGITLTFYDAATVAASGVFGGNRPLAQFNAPQGASGQLGPVGVQIIDMPYTSGLCVNCVSGTTGWTASFTPETNPPFTN
jgi:hypothetical protein